MRGGFDYIEKDLDKFLGDHEVGDVVRACLFFLFQVMPDMIKKIVDGLQGSQFVKVTSKWKKYTVGAGMNNTKASKVRGFLKNTYKKVCKDHENGDCNGFTWRVTPDSVKLKDCEAAFNEIEPEMRTQLQQSSRDSAQAMFET